MRDLLNPLRFATAAQRQKPLVFSTRQTKGLYPIYAHSICYYSAASGVQFSHLQEGSDSREQPDPESGARIAGCRRTPGAPPAATPVPTPVETKPAIDQNAQVVIFGYHRFVNQVRRPDTEITPAAFEAQMKELKDKKIPVIGMQDFLAWKRGEKSDSVHARRS